VDKKHNMWTNTEHYVFLVAKLRVFTAMHNLYRGFLPNHLKSHTQG